MSKTSKVYATAEAPDYWGNGWQKIELKAFRTVRRGVRCIRFRWECYGQGVSELPGVFSDYGHAIRYAETAQEIFKKIRKLSPTELAESPL
jgi:hypothetical protein